MNKQGDFRDNVKRIYKAFVVLFLFVGSMSALLVYLIVDPNLSVLEGKQTATYLAVEADDPDKIEDGIHLRTGLIDDDGLMTVIANCTSCHSAKLITQNRMDRDRWAATIDWMQQTQNLWDLGDSEAVIIDYLVTNYPVVKKGRRQNLTDIQWYALE